MGEPVLVMARGKVLHFKSDASKVEVDTDVGYYKEELDGNLKLKVGSKSPPKSVSF